MSDCHDRNPRNMGMVCSLPAGHASPHAFGDGGTWPLSSETAHSHAPERPCFIGCPANPTRRVAPNPRFGRRPRGESSQSPGNDETCSGACLTGANIGVGGSAIDDIAYPHPDCERHGHLWEPRDNEWSRQYVAAHPERFAPSPEECCGGCQKACQTLLAEVFAAERDRHCERGIHWQVRHIESGAVVPCRDQAEAESHVRETRDSISGPWVAEVVLPPGGASDA